MAQTNIPPALKRYRTVSTKVTITKFLSTDGREHDTLEEANKSTFEHEMCRIINNSCFSCDFSYFCGSIYEKRKAVAELIKAMDEPIEEI